MKRKIIFFGMFLAIFILIVNPIRPAIENHNSVSTIELETYKDLDKTKLNKDEQIFDKISNVWKIYVNGDFQKISLIERLRIKKVLLSEILMNSDDKPVCVLLQAVYYSLAIGALLFLFTIIGLRAALALFKEAEEYRELAEDYGCEWVKNLP